MHQTKYETLQLNIHLFDEMGVQVIEGSHQSRDEDVDLFAAIGRRNKPGIKTTPGVESSS